MAEETCGPTEDFPLPGLVLKVINLAKNFETLTLAFPNGDTNIATLIGDPYLFSSQSNSSEPYVPDNKFDQIVVVRWPIFDSEDTCAIVVVSVQKIIDLLASDSSNRSLS